MLNQVGVILSDSQLRKGALELIILGLLEEDATYGAALVERLATRTDLTISPGTIYPLLSRLSKTGALRTRWEESPYGPPRKIYEVTSRGSARRRELLGEWVQLNDAIKNLSGGTK